MLPAARYLLAAFFCFAQPHDIALLSLLPALGFSNFAVHPRLPADTSGLCGCALFHTFHNYYGGNPLANPPGSRLLMVWDRAASVMCCKCLQDLSLGPLNCTPDYVYSAHTYSLQDLLDILPMPVVDVGKAAAAQLPESLVTYLSELQVVRKPIEFHAMVMAVFASFVAPFGERFAGTA
jgi:hypothetical protein